MKILKIEFENINSLRGLNTIDFTKRPFTSSSLFAITGPTGSGKSTILDVISLALFNQVPRLGKISRNEIVSKGAILTRNQTEARASITYECKSGLYTSNWSISTARTGNLREYEMEIIDHSENKPLDLKKSDVPAKNEELIGLNYNQFIKSVLLAQGDFAQFLRAKKDERGELLEKITGTGIYRQLGKMAFEKYKLVNATVQKQQETIEILEKDLKGEEEIVDLTAALEKEETACKPLEEEIRSIDKRLELKKTIEQQLKDIDILAAKRKSGDISLKEFVESNGLKIQQHEKVRDYGDELRNWTRLTAECTNFKKDITGKTARKDQTLQEIRECLKEISGFTRLETAQEEVEHRLEEFGNNVRQIQEELKSKINTYKGLQDKFNLETRELPCRLNEKDPAATKRQLESQKASTQIKLRELERELGELNLDSPEKERGRLKKHLTDAREAQELAEKIKRTATEIARLNTDAQKIQPVLEKLPLEIDENKAKLDTLKNRIEIISLKRENQLLLASLEDTRAHLRDGEPCPLCGATHHPYSENLPKKNNSLDTELKEAEEAFASLNGKLAAGTATLKHHQNSLQEIQNQINVNEENNRTLQAQLQQNFSHLFQGEAQDWKETCKDFENLLDHLEQFEKLKRSLTCVEVGLPLLKEMVAVSEEGKVLREQLVELYSGKDINSDLQKLQTRWTRLQEVNKAMETQLGELQEKVETSGKELEFLEKNLTSKITVQGFRDISSAGEALLPDPVYYRLHSERDKIEREIAKVAESLKLLNSQLERSREGDIEQSAPELLQLQKEKTLALETANKECQHLRRLLLNDRETREKIKKIKEEIKEKEKHIKRWFYLKELIGDANGKKFNDFAQDLSLSQLIQLANIRLQGLSDRYRIDKPEEGEDDGLVAIDEHMGGQRRSVKTLSGGETFILSLSMALALSDLASKNVEINSLFIDEGFGTLDPETLDQTLDTLERLQAESSKTIGIISHVESLKERIATQIQLTRNGQGYSSLEIK